jgi:hypothetical protein
MRYLTILFSTLCLGYSVFASDIQIVGQRHITIKKSTPHLPAARLYNAPSSMNTITLMNLKLSDRAKDVMVNKARKVRLTPFLVSGDQKKSAVQLGMNGVPPSNQGYHGTCATFANVAAIDALLGKGNYISSLCSLQLGSYLEKNGYSVGGWEGSFGRVVLSQIDKFGVISINNQKKYSCGGEMEYPEFASQPNSQMSLSDFHAISESLEQKQITWTPILDISQFVMQEVDENHLLKQVKDALSNGDRVTFGVLLIHINKGIAGAVGKHHVQNDSWVLTNQMIQDLESGNEFEYGAHEMIITGYDDVATVIDENGQVHQGLLTLRNSWGSSIGNQGDFYMSYDYFKTLAIEAQRIRSLS